MSRTRLVSALAAGMGILAMACWLVTSTFPLAASPQIVSDADGVSVDMGGATLLHRTPVRYPEAARAKGIQGAVAVEATLDSNGNVGDARVLSGPEELRKAALESVLGWHFANGAAGIRRQVMVTFQVGAPILQPELKQPPNQPPSVRAQAQSVETNLAKAETQLRVAEVQALRRALSPRTIKTITSTGLSPELHAELLSKLPVRQGDTYTPETRQKVTRAVLEFDEHLAVSEMSLSETEVSLQIAARDSGIPQRIRVGGNVQHARLIRQPRPIYPIEAKQQRIQGVVQLSAIIGKDGTIQQLEVISGHPLLVPASLEAVKQWVYQITLLNDAPVEVATQIDVNFTLSQ